VRELAHEWLRWLEEVYGAKPSTLSDYRFLLREPGLPHKRGSGVSHGRIMGAFGDRAAADVKTAEVSRFLRQLDGEDLTSQKRQQASPDPRGDLYLRLPRGHPRAAVKPATRTDKRRENPPAALDYYEVEEVEALARACERGEHRVGKQPTDVTR